MGSLLLVSILWAFSFGLIKTYLTEMDASMVAFFRLALALLVFMPILKLSRIGPEVRNRLVGIGAVQYGAMYLLYIQSFRFLQAHEVALFTVFTPLYVCILHDTFRRTWQPWYFVAAIVAVLGGIILVYDHPDPHSLLHGFWLVQGSNVCFAFGQIAYRQVRPQFANLPDKEAFALLFLGGSAVALLSSLIFGQWQSLDLQPQQMWVLLYLGLVATGLGFFLWNAGATQVNSGTLAVMNNLKIPLAVLLALLVFGEDAQEFRLLIGGGLIVGAAIWTEKHHARRQSAESSR